MKRVFGISMFLGLLLLYPYRLAMADSDDDACNRSVLKVPFTAIGASGINGIATLCIGDEGVRGSIRTEGLKPGNAYTVWFFYNTVTPGRFDSNVPDEERAKFSGHVGGLTAASGAKITLLMFDHGKASTDSNILALNLLTPAGGAPAAQAIFTVP